MKMLSGSAKQPFLTYIYIYIVTWLQPAEDDFASVSPVFVLFIIPSLVNCGTVIFAKVCLLLLFLFDFWFD